MSDDQTPPAQPPQKPGQGMVRRFGGGPARSGGMRFDPTCGDGCGHPEHQGFFAQQRGQAATPNEPPAPEPAKPKRTRKKPVAVPEAVAAPFEAPQPAPMAPPAHLTEKTFANAWKNFAGDVRSRLVDGINPHAKPYEHVVGGVGHMHPADPRVDRLGKVCIVGGAAVSLGVALHGVHNIARGMTGWEDKELGQSHAPSLTHVLIGAAETLAGAALLKRVLTGTMKVF